MPPNYSPSEIADAVRSLITALFFHDSFASLKSVSGKPDKSLTKESTLPTAINSLQQFIRLNNFTSLLRGCRTLDEWRVKGRINFHHTCQSPPTILQSIIDAHPQWILKLDQFHGDLPVECGWLLFSSKQMIRLDLQQQLSTLAHTHLNIVIPFLCLLRQIDGPSQYPTVKGHAITICTASPYQSRAHHLPQEVLSPEKQNKFPSRYPFQRTMIFSSPHLLGLSDQTYASTLQEPEEFHHNEEVVKVTGLLPLTHLPRTLGSALLSFSELPPGSQYLIRSIESDTSNPSALYFCTHYATVSYLESFKETLFPTLRVNSPQFPLPMCGMPLIITIHIGPWMIFCPIPLPLSSLLQYSPYGSSINPPLPPLAPDQAPPGATTEVVVALDAAPLALAYCIQSSKSRPSNSLPSPSPNLGTLVLPPCPIQPFPPPLILSNLISPQSRPIWLFSRLRLTLSPLAWRLKSQSHLTLFPFLM